MRKIINIALCLLLVISIVPPNVLCQEKKQLSGIPSEKVIYRDPQGYFLIVGLSENERENLLSLIKGKINSFEWINKGYEIENGNYGVNVPVIDAKNNVTPSPFDLSKLQIIDPTNLPQHITGKASVLFLNIGPIGFCLNTDNKTLCDVGFGKANKNMTGDSDVAKSLNKQGFSKVKGERIVISEPTIGGESSVFYLREHMYNFMNGITSFPNTVLDLFYAAMNAASMVKAGFDLAKAGFKAAKAAWNKKSFSELANAYKKYVSEMTKVKIKFRDVINSVVKGKPSLKALYEDVEKLINKKGDYDAANRLAQAFSKEIREKYGDYKIPVVVVDVKKLENIYGTVVGSLGKSSSYSNKPFLKTLDPNDGEIIKLLKKYKNGKISTEQFIKKYTEAVDRALNEIEKLPLDEDNKNYLKQSLNDLILKPEYFKKEELLIKDSNNYLGKALENIEKGELGPKDNAELYVNIMKELDKGFENVKGIFIKGDNGFDFGKQIFKDPNIHLGFANGMKNELKNGISIGQKAEVTTLGISKKLGQNEKVDVIFNFVKNGKLVKLDELSLKNKELEEMIAKANKKLANLLNDLNSQTSIKKLIKEGKRIDGEIKNIKVSFLKRVSNNIHKNNFDEIKFTLDKADVFIPKQEIKDTLNNLIEKNLDDFINNVKQGKINDFKKGLTNSKQNILNDLKKSLTDEITKKLEIELKEKYALDLYRKSFDELPETGKKLIEGKVNGILKSNKNKIDNLVNNYLRKNNVDGILENQIVLNPRTVDLERKILDYKNYLNRYDQAIKNFKNTIEQSGLVYDTKNLGKSIMTLTDKDGNVIAQVACAVLKKEDLDKDPLELYRILEEEAKMLRNAKLKEGIKEVVYGRLNPESGKKFANEIFNREYLTLSRKLLGSKMSKKFEEKYLNIIDLLKKYKIGKILVSGVSNGAKGLLVNFRTAVLINSFLLLSNDLFGVYAGDIKIYGFVIDMKKDNGNYSDYFVAIMPTYYLKSLGYKEGDAFKAFVEFITGEKIGGNWIGNKLEKAYHWFTPTVETESEKVKEEYIKAYKNIVPALSRSYQLMVIHDGVSGDTNNYVSSPINVIKKENLDEASFSYDSISSYGVFDYNSKHHVQITIFDPPWFVAESGVDSIGLFTRNVVPIILYENNEFITALSNLSSNKSVNNEENNKKLAESYLNSYAGYVIKANDEFYRTLPEMLAISSVLGVVSGMFKQINSYTAYTLESSMGNLLSRVLLAYLMVPVIYQTGKIMYKNSVLFDEDKFLKEAGYNEYVGKYCENVLKEGNIHFAGYDTGVSWYTVYKVLKNLFGFCANVGMEGAVLTEGVSLLLTLACSVGEWKIGEMEQEELKKMFVAMAVCKERNHIFIVTRNIKESNTLDVAIEKLNSTSKYIQTQVQEYTTKKNNTNVNSNNVIIDDYKDVNKILHNNQVYQAINEIKNDITTLLKTTKVDVLEGNNSETYFFKYIYLIYLFDANAYNTIKKAILHIGKRSVNVEGDKIKENNINIAKINPAINWFDQPDKTFSIANKIVLIDKRKDKIMFKIDSEGNLKITYPNLKNIVKSEILLGANKKYHVSEIITDDFIIKYYNGKMIAGKIVSTTYPPKQNITIGQEIVLDNIEIKSNGNVYLMYNGNVYEDSLKQVFLDNNDGVIDNTIYSNYMIFSPRNIVDFNVKDITDIEATKEVNNKPVVDINTNNKTLNSILDNLTMNGIDAIATNDTMITFNKDGTVNITNLTNGHTEQYKNIEVVAGGKIIEKDGKYYILKVFKDPETGLITTALVPLDANNLKDAEEEASRLTDQEIRDRAMFYQPMMYMWTPNGMMYQNPTTGEVKVMNDFAFPINPNFNLYGAAINGNGIYPSPNPLGLTPGVDLNKKIKQRPPLNIPSIPEGIPGVLFIIALFVIITTIRGNEKCNVQNVEEKQ